MQYNLGNICKYRRGKIDIVSLKCSNYISTENMLSNKGGIVEAASLPATSQVQAFKYGDVLVSNIRPYFKKIWKAEFNGGCSNDVLVFESNADVDEDFLYYVLADDAFFAYAMATSKGTKMPRGDKIAIMQYDIPKIELLQQRKIASVLKSLDRKISLNNQINNNLEQQAQLLFDQWFGCHFGEPTIPTGWFLKNLDDMDVLITDYVANGSFKSLAENVQYLTEETNNVLIRLTDYNNNYSSNMVYISDTTYEFLEKSKLFGDEIIISNVGANVGTVFRCPRLSKRMSLAPNAILLRSELYEHYLYLFFLSAYGQYLIQSIVTGSAQPKFNKTNFRSLKVLIPDRETLSSFNDAYTPIYEQIVLNHMENTQLSSLRDILLPKLMSGEIDVSDIQL